MKKYFLLVLLTVVGISAFARKSYVNVYLESLYSPTIYLSGDIPIGIKSYYSNMQIGDVLNLLSNEGYEVELITSGSGNIGSTSTTTYVIYLLSKQVSSNEDSAISIVHSDDGEAYEVARYNLQGMQVNENTKGIQIIVYSNYTTKTVIVE